MERRKAIPSDSDGLWEVEREKIKSLLRQNAVPPLRPKSWKEGQESGLEAQGPCPLLFGSVGEAILQVVPTSC